MWPMYTDSIWYYMGYIFQDLQEIMPTLYVAYVYRFNVVLYGLYFLDIWEITAIFCVADVVLHMSYIFQIYRKLRGPRHFGQIAQHRQSIS